MPNTPVEGYITFIQSKLEKAKVIIFYFGFEGEDIEGGGKKYTDMLEVGPIKLR